MNRFFGMRKRGKSDRGQSLVEILVGVTIAAIIAGSVVGAIVLAVRTNKQSVTSKIAVSLSQDVVDKLRASSEGNWSGIYNIGDKGASTNYFITNRDTIVATDELDAAGSYSSLAIDVADNPVIAYYAQSGDLKVIHCNDRNCEGGDESIETVDSGGFFNSMELDSNGYPVVAHYDDVSQDFKIVHCNDVNCSGGGDSSELIDTRVSGMSLELDSNGYPVVSYQKDVGHNLLLLHCNDRKCSGGDESIATVDGSGSSGDYTSLAISPSTGFPVIAYSDNGKLGVIRCNDVNCSGGDESQNKVDTSVNNTEFISIALDSNEYPVVSYYDASPRYDLKVLHCNDVDCLGGDESIETVDTLGGESTSLELDASGNPVVSYIANDKLNILHCNDPNCFGGNESIIDVDDADPEANISGTSLELDSFGNPVVSYYDDVNDDLKVLHCDDPNCDADVFTALAFASGTEDIIVDGTTYTRWFSVENVMRDSNWDIVESGGTEDPSTQKVTVHVMWPFFGDTSEITVTEYFARTKNRSTVFTDWGGDSDVEGPIDESGRDYSTSTGISFAPGQIFLGGASNIALVQKAEDIFRDSDPSVVFAEHADAGNLLVAVVGARNGTPAPPSGFSTAVDEDITTGAAIYYKIAAGGEQTFNYTGADRGHAVVTEWSSSAGWDASPVDTTNSATCSENPVATCNTGSVFTINSDELLVAIFGLSNGAPSATYTNGFVEDGYGCTGSCGNDEGAGASASLIASSADTYSTTIDISPNDVSEIAAAIAAFKPPAGDTGFLISSTFDTRVSGGTKLNNVLWHGSFGVGGASSVVFQIASSNCSNGATDYATCTTDIGWGGSKTSGDGAFVGPDGTSSTFYEPSAPGNSYAIPLDQHREIRYWRYKVHIDKDGSSTSPVVTDVIINWSP